jgi:hypothetical protein
MEIITLHPDGSIDANDMPDRTTHLNMNCAGTNLATAASLPVTTPKTLAVCKRVDASNFAVQLPPFGIAGAEVEVYARGGTVTVFPQSTFVDGSSSANVASGARFRNVLLTDSFVTQWARLG